jgi:hypothetical protein
MLRRFRAISTMLLGVLGAIAVLAPVAHAAAPRVLLFWGGLLGDRVIIMDDWEANLRLLTTIDTDTGAQLEDLQDRPYVEVAEFWGPRWDAYVRSGEPLEALRPEQGNGVGRLYPAVGGQPPVYVGSGILVGPLGAEGSRILAAYAVPVSLEP